MREIRPGTGSFRAVLVSKKGRRVRNGKQGHFVLKIPGRLCHDLVLLPLIPASGTWICSRTTLGCHLFSRFSKSGAVKCAPLIGHSFSEPAAGHVHRVDPDPRF